MRHFISLHFMAIDSQVLLCFCCCSMEFTSQRHHHHDFHDDDHRHQKKEMYFRVVRTFADSVHVIHLPFFSHFNSWLFQVPITGTVLHYYLCAGCSHFHLLTLLTRPWVQGSSTRAKACKTFWCHAHSYQRIRIKRRRRSEIRGFCICLSVWRSKGGGRKWRVKSFPLENDRPAFLLFIISIKICTH